MTRLLILVEGDSEELFVKNILAPHLEHFSVYATAIVVQSKRLASGKKFTGGNHWPNVRNSLQHLLASSDAWVTTLLDLYGLPSEFPGVPAQATSYRTARDRAKYIQNSFYEAMGNPPRFIPFLIMHEFEAWYFANPNQVAKFYGKPAVAVLMKQTCDAFEGPENINHGKDTHPSKRLESYGMGFKKTAGVALLKVIGLESIRAVCPHFDEWVIHLEQLAE